MSTPTVSVIMTSYNHERFVEECLDAVAAQTFTDFELVITDDCSTDGSVARIESWLGRTGFPATVQVNARNLGVCATRNLALARCRGRYIASAPGDDVLEPDRLERQVACFERCGASVGAVYSDMVEIDACGAVLAPSFLAHHGAVPPPEGKIFDRLIRGSFLPAPAVMIRRAALDAVGPYDESLVFEDYDMWLRLADRFEFRYCPGTLVRYRILPTSLSRSPARAEEMHTSVHAVRWKWLGRSRELDQYLLDVTWFEGRRLLPDEPGAARPMLAAVIERQPTLTRRLFLRLSCLPGAAAVLRRAFAVRDRQAAWMRARHAQLS